MYVRTGAPAYWRGLVFDTYRNGVWTASNRGFVTMQPYVPARLLPLAPPHNLGTFVQVFRVLRPLPGVISAAYPIQSLYAPVSSLREDAYGTFRAPDLFRRLLLAQSFARRVETGSIRLQSTGRQPSLYGGGIALAEGV